MAFMVAILLAEKPQARSVSKSAAMMSSGAGNGTSAYSALSRAMIASPAFAVSC